MGNYRHQEQAGNCRLGERYFLMQDHLCDDIARHDPEGSANQ
jgi:hypothetical protein